MAHDQAKNNGYQEAILLDTNGFVAEGSGQNIFIVKDGNLLTPELTCCLNGITRRTVIEIAKSKNIKVHERKISPEELSNFVGCFLTGTAAEITPVSQIADNNYKVCDLILDLSSSYAKLVRKKKAA